MVVARVPHFILFPAPARDFPLLTMDFSESLSTTTAVAATRAYVAHAVEYRLCVRDAGTLGVVQLFSCLDRVVSVDFSPDGTMVMARLVPSRSMVQVFKVDEPDWTAKVDPSGLTSLPGHLADVTKHFLWQRVS